MNKSICSDLLFLTLLVATPVLAQQVTSKQAATAAMMPGSFPQYEMALKTCRTNACVHDAYVRDVMNMLHNSAGQSKFAPRTPAQMRAMNEANEIAYKKQHADMAARYKAKYDMEHSPAYLAAAAKAAAEAAAKEPDSL